MSMSKYVTLSSSVPIYNKLLDHIENLLNEEDEKYCKILNIRNAIQKGYEKLKSYYSKTDDSFNEIFGTDGEFNSNNYEVEDYLNKPVEHMKTEPLKWWKVNTKLLLHLFLTFKYIIHF